MQQTDRTLAGGGNPRQAAMVPLMNAVIPSKRVAIFDETARKGGPLSTALRRKR